MNTQEMIKKLESYSLQEIAEHIEFLEERIKAIRSILSLGPTISRFNNCESYESFLNDILKDWSMGYVVGMIEALENKYIAIIESVESGSSYRFKSIFLK
jgi:tetrahydromethanopterin S-methyltransferase subunit B